MKGSFSVAMGLFAVALLLFGAMSADAWRSKTHDVYEALTGVTIKVDGDMSDWKGVLENVTGTDGTPFTGVANETNVEGVESSFEEHGGGVWTGPEDHEVSIMMVWEPAAFYLGLIVTDEFHENAANSGWNGDACQILFEMTGKRETGLDRIQYNVALGGDGSIVIDNEIPGGDGLTEDDVAIVRDDGAKKTNYELKFTPDRLGLGDDFKAGQEFGASFCVNDGDEDTPGQKGWGGWYTHSIVFGKDSAKTGLVRLTSGTIPAVEPVGKLTTTWGEMKRQ
jgi:hypothetical protein